MIAWLRQRKANTAIVEQAADDMMEQFGRFATSMADHRSRSLAYSALERAFNLQIMTAIQRRAPRAGSRF